MNNMYNPIIRYHGGKYRLAPWLISQFPPHVTYVEPFGGGGSVLLVKPPSELEIYNDLDDDVVNFFQVLRDPVKADELARQINLTPYSRTEFFNAYNVFGDPIERARRLVVRAQMGYGSAGATKGHTGFRMTGGRLKGTSEISLWRRYPDRIVRAAERMKDVLIEHLDACEAIRIYDHHDTLFFVDPPYLLSTRCKNVIAYRHELTDDQHIELLDTLKKVAGKVILSGYSSPLYDQALPGWQKKTKTVQASGNKGGTSRLECIWINPAAQHHDLFGGAA
jgi:DNA adenine methylase